MIKTSPEVGRALAAGEPVVALESTVLTHGLPRPANLALGQRLERLVREHGGTPATIAVMAGEIRVGLSETELETLAFDEHADKASLWNMAALLERGGNAGTTVATTLYAAAAAGIEVFATGGIGGVHHEAFDESADLGALARYPVVTVAAGAKSVLNLPATLERLETLGVPVVGWRSDHMAGFHLSQTDLPLPARADHVEQIARIQRVQRALGFQAGILVSNPVSDGLDPLLAQRWIDEALKKAQRTGVRGAGVTPALLAALAERSNGATVDVNLRLLEANTELATHIATAIAQQAATPLRTLEPTP